MENEIKAEAYIMLIFGSMSVELYSFVSTDVAYVQLNWQLPKKMQNCWENNIHNRSMGLCEHKL